MLTNLRKGKKLRSILLSLTLSFFIIRGKTCSFGREILVRNELIFVTDMGGSRVHVIDVRKRKVNNRLLDSLISKSH